MIKILKKYKEWCLVIKNIYNNLYYNLVDVLIMLNYVELLIIWVTNDMDGGNDGAGGYGGDGGSVFDDDFLPCDNSSGNLL